jgi:signal transduction histidine kinase
MSHGEREYRLLIVDDDETDRRLYGWLLERQAPGQFDIHHAADGAAGLAALRAMAFDCVLLDFSLPDVTGLEFLTDAVVNGTLPAAFVLITGHGNEAIAVDAMKLGVQDYLVKDHVNEGRLWRAIGRAVSQRELRLRLADSMRALTAANASLEREVAAHKATEAELRAAKEVAEQSDRAKTRFIAMVTHELRTPLNGILGYAQLLRLEGELSAQQNGRVAAMIQSGQHLFGMVERVLDIASIESGGMALHPVPLSVRDLTEGCIAAIGPLASERGLSLHLVWAHDAPRQVVADPARLHQVLLNLLGNAVKFTAAGWVELRVLSCDAPGRLRLEVADTGPGIKESARDRLFQDFERLDASSAVEGSGLGLAIAARFVRLMGGTLGYSPNPSGGSIFWLELPRDEAAPAPPMEAIVAAPPLPAQRVLLVDDLAMNRDVVGGFLRSSGLEVWLAENGQDGIRLASEQSFDIILMDVRMPEMDGLEATRQIRALPAPHGNVPILALTAGLLPEEIAECEVAGMDGLVAKPVAYTKLMQAIADTVGGRRSGWGSNAGAILQPDAGAAALPRLDRTVLDRLLT